MQNLLKAAKYFECSKNLEYIFFMDQLGTLAYFVGRILSYLHVELMNWVLIFEEGSSHRFFFQVIGIFSMILIFAMIMIFLLIKNCYFR